MRGGRQPGAWGCEGEWPKVDMCHIRSPKALQTSLVILSAARSHGGRGGNDLVDICLWLLWGEGMSGARGNTERPFRRGYRNTLQVRGDGGLPWGGRIGDGKK